MKPFTAVQGPAIPLGRANIDTDIIIPARWLKTMTRKGLGQGAFEAIRAEPGNVFDDPRYRGAPILIAGANYGCGSSREHAAWAVADMGIRAIIAPSFSDIHASNAFKNGILTVALPADQVEQLLHAAEEHDLRIDLERQLVETACGDRFSFELDPFRRDCLLRGLDEIAITLGFEDDIVRYEQSLENHLSPVIERSVSVD